MMTTYEGQNCVQPIADDLSQMTCKERKTKLQELYIFEIQENKSDHEQVFTAISKLQDGILNTIMTQLENEKVGILDQQCIDFKGRVLKEILEVKLRYPIKILV